MKYLKTQYHRGARFFIVERKLYQRLLRDSKEKKINVKRGFFLRKFSHAVAKTPIGLFLFQKQRISSKERRALERTPHLFLASSTILPASEKGVRGKGEHSIPPPTLDFRSNRRAPPIVRYGVRSNPARG